MRPRRVLAALALTTLAAWPATGGMSQGAASGSWTSSSTIAGMTTLNATGCASGTAGLTDFGDLLPGSSYVTSSDCSIIFGSNADTSMLRVMQTDGTGSALYGSSNGSLDTSFDTDGKQTTSILASSATAWDVAVQSDGKILLAGSVAAGAGDIALARYNSNGSLDTSFDTDGKVTTAIGAGDDTAEAVAVQPDGKIVVIGHSHNGTNKDFALVRYNANGSLDTSFDTDGIQTTAIGAGHDYAYCLALQADGKVVVGGQSHNGANYDIAVARYSSTGALDATFDTDGKQTTAIGAGKDEGSSCAIQPDGKILVAGNSDNGADDDFAVVRYNTNGSLDTAFDADGKQTTAIGALTDDAMGIALQSDGRIVLGGRSSMGGADDFAVVRYNSDGTLDTTFDSDGKQTTAIGATVDAADAVVVQPDGRIVLGGTSNTGANYDFAAVRYTTSGALDTSFDGDGKQTTAIGASSDMAYAVRLQADGKILVAGNSYNGSNNDFAVIRYGGGGSVADWSGSWGAAGLFAACLHTVANATNTWTLAGSGNCTTAIDGNWNALPTTASKIASAANGVTNATTNLRYGIKSPPTQAPGGYQAPLTFEVIAPNA